MPKSSIAKNAAHPQYANVAQPMRIQARPGSTAEHHYYEKSALPQPWPKSSGPKKPKIIAPGINPDVKEDLIYHGSMHIEHNERGGKPITLYYSANVYSEVQASGKENGIAVFSKPWKKRGRHALSRDQRIPHRSGCERRDSTTGK